MYSVSRCLIRGTFLKIIQNFQAGAHSYRPRRATLYVPGDDERKIAKIEQINVDCVILDCEDGVAVNKKDCARQTIVKNLCSKKLNKSIDWGVRVNSVESGLLSDDLDALCNSAVFAQTLFLPKVNSTKDIDYFDFILRKHISNREKLDKIDLIIYTESCISVLDLPSICRHTMDLAVDGPYQLTGIVFGSDDLCANLGASRSESSLEILYARQRTVLVAKAFKLQAIDMVDINLNDLEGLKLLCEEGARMGYTGKQVIHPKQVEIVQRAFMPSDKVVEWAKALLEAFESHQKGGKGAFVFRGQMIDAPTMKQARNVVETLTKNTSKN